MVQSNYSCSKLGTVPSPIGGCPKSLRSTKNCGGSQGRGVAPRTPPYSLVMPQKSKRKKAPELLARLWRVPSIPQLI